MSFTFDTIFEVIKILDSILVCIINKYEIKSKDRVKLIDLYIELFQFSDNIKRSEHIDNYIRYLIAYNNKLLSILQIRTADYVQDGFLHNAYCEIYEEELKNEKITTEAR